MKKIYIGIFAVLGFTSCEDPISVEVEEGTIQVAIDAFINSKSGPQTIYVNQTKQFFDNVSQEAYDADSVYVIDDLNNKYIFESPLNDGEFVWDDSTLVHEGRTYDLVIKKGSIIYTSKTKANPVPPIDSLNWEYVPAGLGQENGSYAVELVARDLIGQPDYYWIRFMKNGKYDTRLEGLNVSVDGTFSESSQGDGELFIAPISTLTAYNPDDSIGVGDEVTYEIWSIEPATYSFWQEVQNQAIVGGGIGALFATPTANVRTNIKVENSDELKDKAVGWFSASIISSGSQLIFEKEGEKLSFDINN